MCCCCTRGSSSSSDEHCRGHLMLLHTLARTYSSIYKYKRDTNSSEYTPKQAKTNINIYLTYKFQSFPALSPSREFLPFSFSVSLSLSLPFFLLIFFRLPEFSVFAAFPALQTLGSHALFHALYPRIFICIYISCVCVSLFASYNTKEVHPCNVQNMLVVNYTLDMYTNTGIHVAVYTEAKMCLYTRILGV